MWTVTRRLQRSTTVALLTLLPLVGCSGSDQPASDTSRPVESPAAPSDPEMSSDPITRQQLIDGAAPDALIANSHFAPPPDAVPATEPFEGTLRLAETPMDSRELAGAALIAGKDPALFPRVSVSFFSHDGHLVPRTQDVIRRGSLPASASYWDLLVQPGRIWSEGADDQGWNRGGFPFALVNSVEGETHTGIATFLYQGDRVSSVRFQIVQQTAPYLVTDYFIAWGVAEAEFAPAGPDDLSTLRADFAASLRDRLPIASWEDLEGEVGRDLELYDTRRGNDLVLRKALLHDGVLYRDDCPTVAGPLPYCDSIRYGIWSVTKSAMLNVAMLRLAQKYGTGFLNEPIGRTVPDLRTPTWRDVTYAHLANMASGHGATRAKPNCYLCDYSRWYEARSERSKIAEALDYPAAWTPGSHYNYRDQDAFLLGVALERYLRSREGPEASIDRLLIREVYRPIGIHAAPANRTIDPGAPDHLMLAYGYYPTLDDLAKIGLLYQRHGSWDGRQILRRGLVDELLPRSDPPTDRVPKRGVNEFGRTFYAMNWHVEPYVSTDGCRRYLSSMDGWGGNLVTLLPDSVVALRIANAWTPPADFSSSVFNARVGDELVDFCA